MMPDHKKLSGSDGGGERQSRWKNSAALTEGGNVRAAGKIAGAEKRATVPAALQPSTLRADSVPPKCDKNLNGL